MIDEDLASKLRALGIDLPAGPVRFGGFGDSPELSVELLGLTRTTEVEVVPFNEVSAQFAAREGEGDGSLVYWRKAHWSFFSRECQRIGRLPSETMPVVCSSFEVLRRM